jgi:hypothetical protein
MIKPHRILCSQLDASVNFVEQQLTGFMESQWSSARNNNKYVNRLSKDNNNGQTLRNQDNAR